MQSSQILYFDNITTRGIPAIYKNSGILRYSFGDGSSGGSASAPALKSGLDANGAWCAYCLGDEAVTTPDDDGQLFGMTPGYAAITPAAGSVFAGLGAGGVVPAAALAVTGPGSGIRFPPNSPNADSLTSQARTKANGRIPAGTKVAAWFQSHAETAGASTVPNEAPYAIVQTEVKQNSLMTVAGVADHADGQQYLSSIRVIVANVGGSGSVLSGTLFVWIQHSFEDIPGFPGQDQMIPFELA